MKFKTIHKTIQTQALRHYKHPPLSLSLSKREGTRTYNMHAHRHRYVHYINTLYMHMLGACIPTGPRVGKVLTSLPRSLSVCLGESPLPSGRSLQIGKGPNHSRNTLSPHETQHHKYTLFLLFSIPHVLRLGKRKHSASLSISIDI